MTRNAFVFTGGAALLSLLALPPQLVTGRGQTAQVGLAPSTGSAPSAAPGDRREPADVAETARDETSEEMAKLFHDVCAPGQEGTAIEDAAKLASAAARLKARQEAVRGLCHQLQAADFIVAVIPDPVHTRLALFFDRLVEVVQQALQDDDYQFVRAVIPWDHRAHAEPPAFESRLAAEAYAAAKAELPGLMAFRGTTTPRPTGAGGQAQPGLVAGPRPASAAGQPPLGAASHTPAGAAGQRRLFVLIVGESPTGGIVTRQFRAAIQWIKKTTGNERPPLRILGPTFSGSLASLAELLSCGPKQPCYSQSLIFSGSVSSRDAVRRFFEKQGPLGATLVSFQETSEVAIERFAWFLDKRGYQPESIAILSEDETVYGGLTARDETVDGGPTASAKGPSESNLSAKRCERCVRLYFPREISRLRAAYQGLDVKDLDGGARSAPREILPLNLEISGADEDTVPAFSKQMALSQEGVLLGIVSELRKHPIRFVILRATDPLDLLFLGRYLASAYPQGRIVTIGADILFPREVENKQLHGLLALTTYTLAPVGNHRFLNYDRHGERVFPSTVEAGTYNAARSLLAYPRLIQQPIVERQDRRYMLLTGPDLDLYQYGWKGQLPHPTPPVHLLALGRDGYWPLAHLEPPPEDETTKTLLPFIEANQFSDQLRLVVVPVSWKVADLAALALAFGFACSLWRASVRSTSQPMVLLAPPAADARAALIAAATLFLECIFVLLLHPLVQGSELCQVEHATPLIALSLIAVLAVVAAAAMDLGDRARLADESATHAKEWCGVPQPAPLWRRPPFIGITLLAGPLLALWWLVQGPGGDASVRRFAALRSLELTSGLSPILPMLLMFGAGLWWAFHVTAGSALLLDGRRFRLPRGVQDQRSLALADCGDDPLDGGQRRPAGTQSPEQVKYIVGELLDALPPRTSLGGHYHHYLALAALVVAVGSLIGGYGRLMTLEERPLEWLLSALVLLASAWITGTTVRLWEIWLKTRRLLQVLDSRPLRGGFRRLDGFSCKSLWQISLVDTMEFQSLLARVSEARDCAIRTHPQLVDSDIAKTIDQDRKELFAHWKSILEQSREQAVARWKKFLDEQPREQGVTRWKKFIEQGVSYIFETRRQRRDDELCLTRKYGRLQHDTALAAGLALDLLAQRWGQEKERPRRRPMEEAPDEPGLRACERFVCLVYVSFLLVVLMRIRSLMMAIGGMYILVVVGINSYPFQPRAMIAALSAILLVYITSVATVVFAQMHRDNTLSHITNTKPGELGKDFWIRTTSFAALPLFTYLAAQFPQVNRFLYSWLEPAIQALHK
jgi:hypothetical protein